MKSCVRLARWFDARRTPDAAQQFVQRLVRMIGIGFHPDTPFGDYVESPTSDVRVFGDEEADYLDDSLARAHSVLHAAELDVYEIGFAEQNRLMILLIGDRARLVYEPGELPGQE